jgi:hypothetical protein
MFAAMGTDSRLNIATENRAAAGEVYAKYKDPFLTQIKGAKLKQLLLRDEDVQVLHGFDTEADAKSYLGSGLFTADVVGELKALLQAAPDIRIYRAA